MATQTLDQSLIAAKSGRRPSLLAYYIYSEVCKMLRLPGFIIPSLVFPVAMLVIFGMPSQGRTLQGVQIGSYLLASLAIYSTMFIGLIAFCSSIATERGLGWNKLLRVAPLNPLVYFTAKVVTTALLGLLSISTLFVVGALFTHTTLALLTWLGLAGVAIVGMLPFMMLGFAIGYMVGPTSAATIANLVYLPISFASGLLVPLPVLPPIFRSIAPYLPGYHIGELERSLLGVYDATSLWTHLAWGFGYAVVFSLLAFYAYRRDEEKQFA